MAKSSSVDDFQPIAEKQQMILSVYMLMEPKILLSLAIDLMVLSLL
jgi:hypothetical protein